MATQFGTYSLADIAAQLKGCDAYVAGRGSRPIIGDDEFTRYWTIDHALIERARSFADLYGDGDTFNADTPEVHHHVIVDPAAEQGVAQLGTWRVVRNFEDPDQKGKLFQTLRKGYLLPPEEGGDVSWTALDAEARIWRVNEVDATLAGMLVPHYVILYPHVAKTHVHEFCAALLARPDIENPVFDEHPALAGTYKFSVVKNEEQDDGTSYVFAVIVSTAVPDGYTHQLYNGCAVSEWATFFYMLHTLPTVPASTSGIDYRLEGIAFDKELGLWECRLVKTETKTITIPQHTATQDLFEKRERAVWLGVRDGDKDHLGVSVPVEVPGIAASDGAIVSLARSKNKDCTQDLSQEREHELQLEDASRTEQKTIFETNVEQTDKSMPASTDVTVPAAADGVVVRKTSTKTRANKRDITTKTDTENAVSNAENSLTKTLFETRASVVNMSQSAEDTTVPEPTAGVITTKGNKKTPGGKVHVTVETVTAKAVTVTHSSESRADQSTETVVEKNADAQADATGGGSGTVVRASSRKNEFGKFDNTKETITAVELSVSHTSESRADQTSITAVTRNAAAKEDATAVAGKVVRASSRKNEFGLYDNSKETITAVNQTVTHASESRADQTSETVVEKNAVAQADATGGGSGTVVRANSRKNEFGLYDNSKETITAVNQTTTSGEDRADQSSTRVLNTQADAAITAPPTATAGTVARVENRPTEFGKVATTKEVITAKAQTTTHTSESRADQTVETVISKNADAKADATGVTGKVVRASSRENEFAKFDNNVETITPLPQDTGWVECVTRHGTAYTRTWSNQEAGFGEALDFDGGSNNSLSTRLNAFGLEDGSASKTPYEGHGENDAVPVGWEERDLVTIQTRYEGDQKRECTVTEYYRYYSLRSSAENGIDSLITELSEEANKASSANISVVTLRTGQRRYRAQVRTTPTFGEWVKTI